MSVQLLPEQAPQVVACLWPGQTEGELTQIAEATQDSVGALLIFPTDDPNVLPAVRDIASDMRVIVQDVRAEPGLEVSEDWYSPEKFLQYGVLDVIKGLRSPGRLPLKQLSGLGLRQIIDVSDQPVPSRPEAIHDLVRQTLTRALQGSPDGIPHVVMPSGLSRTEREFHRFLLKQLGSEGEVYFPNAPDQPVIKRLAEISIPEMLQPIVSSPLGIDPADRVDWTISEVERVSGLMPAILVDQAGSNQLPPALTHAQFNAITALTRLPSDSHYVLKDWQ